MLAFPKQTQPLKTCDVISNNGLGPLHVFLPLLYGCWGGGGGGGCPRWENDRMEGEGVHVDAEGSRYEGHFRANYRDGHGRCQWGNRHDTLFRHGF